MRRAFINMLLCLLLLSCSPPQRHHSHSHKCDDDTILHYIGFTVKYNRNTKQPDWVDYTLTKDQVETTKHTSSIARHFTQDPQLILPQACNTDYRKSGYVKGHMARRMDMKWSEQAVRESDYFTNICPQDSTMNHDVWQEIENQVRRVATQYDSVHIICGPIFIDNANGYIGSNHLPVPDFFFKTLLIKDATGYHTIAFLCPNNDKPITMKDATCTVDKVEALSKIDVYSYLPDKTESAIESTFNTMLWGL